MCLDKGIFGNFNWELLGCAVLCWVFIYKTISNGVNTTGKVAMFTVIAPYAMLTVLLVRVLLMENSWKGIQFLLNFDAAKLLSPTTWYRVMDQHFFQHGLGFGYVFCFSTFRSYSDKIWRSSVL